jgi:hypothetical protein
LFWRNMKLPQACKHKKAPHCCEAFYFLAPLIDQKYNHQPMIEYVIIYKSNT